MVSERKLAANRRNARRSTGPKTAKGKAAVRHNALKHGLLAQEVVITTGEGRENQAEFDQLLAELTEDLQPVGITEKLLVERIAQCHWRMKRAARYETAEMRRTRGLPPSEDDEPEPSTLAQSLIAGLAGLAPAPGGLATTLRKTTAGIDVLLELVGDAHFEVQLQGHLPKLYQQRLLAAFGAEVGSVANTCFLYNHPLVEHGEGEQDEHNDEDEVQLPQLWENPPSPEECKQELLQALSDEFEALEYRRQQLAEHEAAQRELDQACLALPPEGVTDRLARYETAIDRQLYKALDELGKRQRERRGRGRGTSGEGRGQITGDGLIVA